MNASKQSSLLVQCSASNSHGPQLKEISLGRIPDIPDKENTAASKTYQEIEREEIEIQYMIVLN